MDRIWYVKLSLCIAIVIATAIVIWGAAPERYQPGLVRDHINTDIQLGLDLQGGVRLVYEVLIEDAIRQRRRQTAEGLASAVTEDLHVRNVGWREEGQRRFQLLFEAERDASKCDHAFIRRSGWADERGRGSASEAHFRLSDETSRSTRDVANATLRALQQQLGLEGARVETLPQRRFAILLRSPEDLSRLQGEAIEQLRDVELAGRYRSRITFDLSEDAYASIRDTAVNQAMEVISNRIDELGVANTTVSQSDVNIIIEIPGQAQTDFVARTKRIIERTARLEFKMVDDRETAIYQKLRPLVEEDERVELVPEDSTFFLRASDTKLPDGEVLPGNKVLAEFVARAQEKGVEIPESHEFRYEEITPGRTRQKTKAKQVENVWRTYYLQSESRVTGEHIADAHVAYEQQGPDRGRPYVAINFNDRGRKNFGEVTKANVGKRMAIVLDDRINSAPVIQEAILGGSARITMGGYGDFQQVRDDAQELVVVLRAGALPAPITLANEETIGPQLGQDSIRRGEVSILVGGLLVFIFMVVYYNKAGVIADAALALNLGLIIAILAMLGATLTLPGLAGIALTIGMAVDANIIIYERIREELRAGKSPRAATDAGFQRAFWTIFDSQVTTFIAGVVLLQYGTGPIKGFAVTLLIGIVTSMFTAIWVSRVMFDWWTRRKRLERLSIG